MNTEILWTRSVSLYGHLEENRCMCLSSSEETQSIFINLFQTCFQPFEYFDGKEECQFLCIDVLRLSAEIYIEEISKYRSICKEIVDFFRRLDISDVFFKMLEYFLTTDNKYLSWTLAKALLAIMYGTQLPLLKTWIENIRENLLQYSTQKSIRLIELLTSVMSYCRTVSKKNDKSKCKNVLPLPLLPVEDNYSYICVELAPVWNHLVETFVKPPNSLFESHGLIAFLNLWKSLQEIDMKSPVYLNKKFVLNFLSYNVSESKAFNVYVDVIIHIFSTSLKGKLWETSDSESIQNAVSFALEAGFLESLPSDDDEFCNVIKKTSTNESIAELGKEPKFSLTSKRIFLIFFNLLAEFEDKHLLCQMLEKILKAMSQLMPLKDNFVSIQIVDIFSEEDDLLFGVMLATLRIYLNLQHEMNKRIVHPVLKMFQDYLNPHVVFIQMLQLLGFSYSELLSFLLSDETCCLLYLTHYLKLLLTEKNQFLLVHDMYRIQNNFTMLCETKPKRTVLHANQGFLSHEAIIETHDLIKLRNTSTGNSLPTLKPFKNSEICDTFPGDFYTKSCIVSDRSFPRSGSLPPVPSSLVSYSCSSSSEEELEMECGASEGKTILMTLSVLTNLKVGIQKLVDLKEFPYNAGPLLSLLNSCEVLLR